MRRGRSGELEEPLLSGGTCMSVRAWPTASAYDWRRGDGADWGAAMVRIILMGGGGSCGCVFVRILEFGFGRANDKY